MSVWHLIYKTDVASFVPKCPLDLLDESSQERRIVSSTTHFAVHIIIIIIIAMANGDFNESLDHCCSYAKGGQ